LVVDAGAGSGINNAHLQSYLDLHAAEYPLAGLPHTFLTLSKTFQEDLDIGNSPLSTPSFDCTVADR